MQNIPALLRIAAYFVVEFLMFRYSRNRKGLAQICIDKHNNRRHSFAKK